MRRRARKQDAEGQELCLGLVILARPGRMDEARAQLERESGVELGELQGHRLPACAMTRLGADEELLARLEALPAVLKAEVIYAELLEESAGQ